MHLETFKTLENVQSTKFETADALPENGLIVVNNDFEACASRPVCNVDSKRYGVACPGGCDYRATDVRYSPQGTSFTVEGRTDSGLNWKHGSSANATSPISLEP